MGTSSFLGEKLAQPIGERRPRNRDENGNLITDPAITGNPNAPLKYDIPELERHREWIAEQIWRAVAGGQSQLLKNPQMLSNFLAGLRPDWFKGEHGIVDQKEKGRHIRNLFLGNLEEEGWGMGDEGYSRALDHYRPNWSRMVSGMNKDKTTGLYSDGGGKWFDAFGRLIRTDPATPTAAPGGPTATPTITAPSATNTTPTANATPNPVFYGGTTAPSPYGIGPPSTRMTQQQVTANRNKGTNQPNTPAWYGTWRF